MHQSSAGIPEIMGIMGPPGWRLVAFSFGIPQQEDIAWRKALSLFLFIFLLIPRRYPNGCPLECHGEKGLSVSKNEMPISVGKGICKYTYKKRAGPLESAQNGKTKKWRRKSLIQKAVQNLQFIPANK
jgi:hypothetical protein